MFANPYKNRGQVNILAPEAVPGCSWLLLAAALAATAASAAWLLLLTVVAATVAAAELSRRLEMPSN